MPDWLNFGLRVYMAATAALVTGVVFGLIIAPLLLSGRHSEAENEQEYHEWRTRTGRWAR